MGWTLNEVVDNARRIVQDTVDTAPGGFRYPDAQLIDALNYGIIELRRIRPDIFVGTYDQDLPKYSVGQLITLPATTIALTDQWIPPLTQFMAGWVELTDDEFTIDGRAATLLQQFAQKLAIGG